MDVLLIALALLVGLVAGLLAGKLLSRRDERLLLSSFEGLGNKFLSHIRESDAICQVTRVFRDDDVTHVDGKVSPADDISTIRTSCTSTAASTPPPTSRRSPPS